MVTEYTENRIHKAIDDKRLNVYEEFDLILKMNIEDQLDAIRLCLIELTKTVRET